MCRNFGRDESLGSEFACTVRVEVRSSGLTTQFSLGIVPTTEVLGYSFHTFLRTKPYVSAVRRKPKLKRVENSSLGAGGAVAIPCSRHASCLESSGTTPCVLSSI